MIEAYKGNNSKRECRNTPLRHHLALADTHFDLSFSRDSYFGRNLYSCHTPSLLSRQKPVELSNRNYYRLGVMCFIISLLFVNFVNTPVVHPEGTVLLFNNSISRLLKYQAARKRRRVIAWCIPL